MLGRAIGERVVLMPDYPPSTLAAQADGEAQPHVRLVNELLRLGTFQQRPGISDIGACSYLEFDDLEERTLLPLEEGRPGLAVGIQPADAVVGRRDIEHDDVVGVIT